MVVIEMNPRVSRSSALASKATGFPIAKIAAKLAVGYTLDELPTTSPAAPRRPRSSRPSTTWSPRCRASPSRSSRCRCPLTTQMKSVGEVMAIGRTFQEALQKALRGLETGSGLRIASTGRRSRSRRRGRRAHREPSPRR
jgi:carbamoyl-phosphate synthase large subunit